MQKKLYRVQQNSMLGGICTGLADYFNIDLTIIRLLWVVSLIFSFGTSLIAYFVLWGVLPNADRPMNSALAEDGKVVRYGDGKSNNQIAGIILVTIGVLYILKDWALWSWIKEYTIPLILIGAGAYIIISRQNKDNSGNSNSGNTNSDSDKWTYPNQ